MAPRQRHITHPLPDEISRPSSSLVPTNVASVDIDDDDDNDTTSSSLIIDTTATSSGTGSRGMTKPLLIDTTTRNLLPHPNSTTQLQDEYITTEIARDRHDIFNIVALLFVIAATIINWDFRYILQGPTYAWKGQYFYWNWATTVSYFLIDLMWVAYIPICVKSPDVIIKHHFVAIAYLSGPLAWPEYRWFMGACLSVEINTWFLILRRVLYKRKDHIHYAITETVSILFYITWIAIRVFLYPMIMYIFIQMAYERILETNVLFHWPMIFMPVHFFLCVLNLKWTYDLFLPIITKYCTTMNNVQQREIGVSRGL